MDLRSEKQVNGVNRGSAEQVNEVNREDRLGKAAASPNSLNLTERGITGHERRGEPKLQSGIDFASEKAFPESRGRDMPGEPMHLSNPQ